MQGYRSRDGWHRSRAGTLLLESNPELANQKTLMPPQKNSPPNPPEEELVRLAVLLLRRMVGTQADTIVELSRAGFTPTRIAMLLGTTPNTVNQALVRSKKKK